MDGTQRFPESGQTRAPESRELTLSSAFRVVRAALGCSGLVAAVALVAALLLGGCNGDGATTPTSSFVATRSPTTSIRATTDPITEIINRYLKENQFQQPTTDSALLTSSSNGSDQLKAANEYVIAVINHADTIWSNWFIANNLPEPYVSYSILEPGDVFQSKCTEDGKAVVATSDYNNAFYCRVDNFTAQDGTVYEGGLVLPLETILKMWNGDIFGKQSKQAGDFAAATIVAHEFGHHIQDELAQDLSLPSISPPKNKELIADCFAGVWASAVYKDGLLQAGDVNEAIDAVSAIGDFNTGPGSHGTPAERENAWRIGYYGLSTNPIPGVPKNCVDAFWTSS